MVEAFEFGIAVKILILFRPVPLGLRMVEPSARLMFCPGRTFRDRIFDRTRVYARLFPDVERKDGDETVVVSFSDAKAKVEDEGTMFPQLVTVCCCFMITLLLGLLKEFSDFPRRDEAFVTMVVKLCCSWLVEGGETDDIGW
jgi:hypothetical protein